jgi:hypothetical protein
MRRGEPRARSFLPSLRDPARSGADTRVRTQDRLGPLRQPGRLHRAFGMRRPRGRQGAPPPLPRAAEAGDREPRRHGREIRRRRRDGGVRCRGRARGRRGARPCYRATDSLDAIAELNEVRSPSSSWPCGLPSITARRSSRSARRRKARGMVAGDVVNTASRSRPGWSRSRTRSGYARWRKATGLILWSTSPESAPRTRPATSGMTRHFRNHWVGDDLGANRAPWAGANRELLPS